MSRARYVWVVQNDVGAVIGAFTVRHELERALKAWNDPGAKVTRCDTARFTLPHPRIELPSS